MYCQNCGAENGLNDKYCRSCGIQLIKDDSSYDEQPLKPVKEELRDITPLPIKPSILCPRCHSDNVLIQRIQENLGSYTKTKSKSKYKEKGHGLLWWFCIGSWWWIVDLILWIIAFIPRLILRLFYSPYRKKKGKSVTYTSSSTTNKIKYRTICTCQNCGKSWNI